MRRHLLSERAGVPEEVEEHGIAGAMGFLSVVRGEEGEADRASGVLRLN